MESQVLGSKGVQICIMNPKDSCELKIIIRGMMRKNILPRGSMGVQGI